MPRDPRRPRGAVLACAVALTLTACTTSTPQDPTSPAPSPPATATMPPSSPSPEPSPEPAPGEYGVAAGDAAAVEVGMDILEDGGNAVDAAIAAAFAVAVVAPYASGMGGGGSTIVVPQNDGQSAVAYDYREVVNDDGVIPASGTGIPGFVAGMGELHAEHGQADWDRLLAPAIQLAADGHPVSALLAQRLREDVGPGLVAELPQFQSAGSALSEGDLLVQEDLAGTMEVLAEEGPESFYTGTLADSLAAVPGIDAGSLAGYEVVSDEPVRGVVGEHEVLGPLPPLPGAPMVQMLQVAEALGVAEAEPGSVQFVEGISRAWEVADESAGTVLGDPAFVDVPVAELTDPDLNAALAAEVADQAAGDGSATIHSAALGGDDDVAMVPASATGARAATPSAGDAGPDTPSAGDAGPDTPSAGDAGPATPSATDGPATSSVVDAAAATHAGAGNTTHISVVDSEGTTVSMTNTITHWFGGAAGYHAGFFLNDQLTRFSAIDSAANQPEPGKRSVSWAVPLIVLDDQGRSVLVIGTPGGRLIPNILTQVYTRWAWHGQSLREAVEAPRFHLEGQTMQVEETLPSSVVDELAARGYGIEVVPASLYSYGSVNGLLIDPETGALSGAADPRRDAAFDTASP